MWPALGTAQGTLLINFNGPPDQPPGSAYNVQSYSESGMQFVPLAGSDGFGRVWSNPPSALPNDGTPYLDATLGDSLTFAFGSGDLFGLSSVELAGYSTVVPDFSVEFIGYHPDGSAIATTFSGNGTDFQTFPFGLDWASGLSKVEVSTPLWSMDNLVVTVPEPSTGALLFIAGLTFLVWRNRKRISQ